MSEPLVDYHDSKPTAIETGPSIWVIQNKKFSMFDDEGRLLRWGR